MTTTICFAAAFIGGASFGCLVALCALGFARSNGEYDRALSGA
jgi:hypothetical protein